MAGVRARLEAAGLRPVHRWGQNFLCDPAVLAAVVEAAELSPGEQVLEVGAGLGTLTIALADQGAQVHAVEVDPALCRLLRSELKAHAPRCVTVICADVLRASDQELVLPAAAAPFKVVGNIPYYLTSDLLERLLASWPAMTLAVVMLQEEAADRLLAEPGGPGYGMTSLMTRYFAQAQLLRSVPASAFWPQPGVRSAILRLRRRPQPPVAVDPALLFQVIRAAFGRRRKQIRNSLAGPPLGLARDVAAAALEGSGIDGRRRAEELSLTDFGALTAAAARAVASAGTDPSCPKHNPTAPGPQSAPQ